MTASAADRLGHAADRLRDLLQDAPADVEGVARERAHALLDAALDLAEIIRARDDATPIDQPMAFAIDAAMSFAGDAGRLLAQCIAGWTTSIRLPVAEWGRLAAEVPDAWRNAAAACLAGGAPLPRIVASQLHHALRDLDSEVDVPAILKPPPLAEGYGRQPKRRQAVEQLLLTWVEIEIARRGAAKRGDDASLGSGQRGPQPPVSSRQPKRVVWDEVASACRCSVENLQSMLVKWRKRDTRHVVDATLAAARTFGAGGTVPHPWPREVWILSRGMDGGLEAIASAFREASQNRPRRGSRDGSAAGKG